MEKKIEFKRKIEKKLYEWNNDPNKVPLIVDGLRQIGKSYIVDKFAHEEYENAKKGKWNVLLTPTKYVPHEWFGELRGKNLLGLASGGGQQAPNIFSIGSLLYGIRLKVYNNKEVCW